MSWPFPSASSAAAGLNAPRLVLVTPPGTETLTAAEIKLHCKIDTDADDALIAALNTAARRIFEQLTGRSLVITVWRAEWDALPRAGTYSGAATIRELELPRAPLVSVAWVKYLDSAGVEQTFDPANYTVDSGLDADRFGRLWLNASASWPDLGDFPGALRCQFTSGYGLSGAVPEEIKAALKLLVTHLYENRGPVNIGNIVSEIPFTLKTLIEMHTVRTLY